MSTDMTSVEVLRKARSLIRDPERWCQQYFRTGGDRFCSVGAIWFVHAPETVTNEATDLLGEAVGSRALTLWNDAPERTHAEILDGFDRAIALAEASPS